MTKRELRRLFLERRRALPAEELAARSERISEAFFGRFDLAGVRVLHIFLPITGKSEIDTTIIIGRLRGGFPDIRIAVPRIKGELLEAVEYRTETEIAVNAWGVPEPVGGKLTEPAGIDLVAVPLLCFDRSGHRVGYGKGFYDRFLARCRPDCLKVGLSLFPPVGRITDTDEHDVRLDETVVGSW